jgi:hypothetical protein
MGWIESGWEELSKRLRLALEPFREGEELVGVVHAATGAPTVVRAGDIEASAIWGWGGSIGDWLSASAGNEIRFTAGGRKYKLMVLGGNALEDALSGPSQRSGLQALLEFLLAARR